MPLLLLPLVFIGFLIASLVAGAFLSVYLPYLAPAATVGWLWRRHATGRGIAVHQIAVAVTAAIAAAAISLTAPFLSVVLCAFTIASLCTIGLARAGRDTARSFSDLTINPDKLAENDNSGRVVRVLNAVERRPTEIDPATIQREQDHVVQLCSWARQTLHDAVVRVAHLNQTDAPPVEHAAQWQQLATASRELSDVLYTFTGPPKTSMAPAAQQPIDYLGLLLIVRRLDDQANDGDLTKQRLLLGVFIKKVVDTVHETASQNEIDELARLIPAAPDDELDQTLRTLLESPEEWVAAGQPEPNV